MEKEIRKGQKPFYGDPVFSRGLSRSGYFNLKESQELQNFGDTLQQLASRALAPINEVEQTFVNEVNSDDNCTLSASKLWKKYLAAIIKSKTFHSFSRSSLSLSASTEFKLEESLDEVDELDLEE